MTIIDDMARYDSILLVDAIPIQLILPITKDVTFTVLLSAKTKNNVLSRT